MIKLICIKDSIDWFGNITLVKKGQIVFSKNPDHNRDVLRSLNNEYLGFFKMDDFMRLDKFRENRINKILNDE